MGLLDGLLGSVLGGGNPTQQQAQVPLSAMRGGLAGGSGGMGNVLLQSGLSMIQQNDGLGGVLGKFRESGLGAQAGSWVGTGQNLNLEPDQLQQVFGFGALGVSQDQAGSALPQMLPELINQLTPDREIPSPKGWQRWRAALATRFVTVFPAPRSNIGRRAVVF